VRTMPLERSHGRVVDLLDIEAFTLEPDCDVPDAVKMPSRHVRLVAGPDELTLVVVE